MIRVITGHLGCGRWRLKQAEHIPFLSHMQLFSRRGEFRIGPDQVVAVKKISTEQHELRVEIQFTDERFCQALIDPAEYDLLASMVDSSEPAPLAKNQTQNWINAILVLLVFSVIFEMVK